MLRGVVLLARTAGLIGQLAEELRHPVANDIFPPWTCTTVGRPRPLDSRRPSHACCALIETPGSPAVPGERPERTCGEGEVLVAIGADRAAGPPVRLGHLLLRGAVDAVRARCAGRRARAGGTDRPGEGTPVWFATAAGMQPGDGSMRAVAAVPEWTSSRSRRARTRSWSPRSGSRRWRPWMALTFRGGLAAGERVLVLGAGGCGRPGRRPARPIRGAPGGSSPRPAGSGRGSGLWRSAQTWRCRSATPTTWPGWPTGCAWTARWDLVVDPLFGAPAAAALRVLRPHGRLVNLGGSAAETAPIDSSTLRSRSLRVLGYTKTS